MSGLRERKKQQTRQLIADTARELFAERGFEAVTVADIARAADVSAQTVFNYFPTKEDLFYSRLEAFEERAAGGGARPRSRTRASWPPSRGSSSPSRASLEDTERLRTVTRVITESPALLARERQVLDHYASALAALLADETGDTSVEPLVTAHALIGLHRSLIEHVRRRVRRGATGPEIAAQRPRRGRARHRAPGARTGRDGYLTGDAKSLGRLRSRRGPRHEQPRVRDPLDAAGLRAAHRDHRARARGGVARARGTPRRTSGPSWSRRSSSPASCCSPIRS